MLPRPNSMYQKKWFARTWKFRSCRKGMTGGIKDVKKSPKLEGYYIQIGEKYGAHHSSPTFPNPYAMHLFTKNPSFVWILVQSKSHSPYLSSRTWLLGAFPTSVHLTIPWATQV